MITEHVRSRRRVKSRKMIQSVSEGTLDSCDKDNNNFDTTVIID